MVLPSPINEVVAGLNSRSAPAISKPSIEDLLQ